jgi:pyruvate ferredoxin oxidoreductase alpha subunit/phenylglyoxylate dehydrogenase alpha subunit
MNKTREKIKVLDGNEAAATGAMLARPTVVSVYPITPQSHAAEYIAQLIASGELDAEIVEAEGEHSVISALQGAALSGSRTFTATACHGLFFMFEAYLRTSTLRLPIVMCIANRELNGPTVVAAGQSDSFVVREAGWIQIYVESNQEILDTVIMAYKIAEHEDVCLPINVCYDGWYLSYLSEPVIIPEQEKVDKFLPPYKIDAIFDPDTPITIDPWTPTEIYPYFRNDHCEGMEVAKRVIIEVEKEFQEMFGRSYGGMVEEYRTEGAELILVTVGSCTGTARVVVDQLRDQENIPVGLVKLRMLRPFPRRELCQILDGRAAVGVMDRQVSFGWNSGSVLWELRSALYDAIERPRVIGFVGGLAGADITKEDLTQAFQLIQKAAAGEEVPEVTWFRLDQAKEIMQRALTP